ncbi:MAG: SIMPL domain-containing protein, partial [Pseudomonadota bacterium]
MTTDTLSPAARRPGFRLSRLSVWIAAACVLMGAAPSALAQSGAVSGGTVERNARFVTVTAQGTVSATPDLATITAGVVTEAETAQEAMRLNARRITRMVRALEELGIERRDRQTTAFNVTPQRDRR